MKKTTKPPMGTCRQTGSGRWQAFHIQDGHKYLAPHTYASQPEGWEWLWGEWRNLQAGLPPVVSVARATAMSGPTVPLLADYARDWLSTRRVDGKPLAENSLIQYEMLQRREINPDLGHFPIDKIDQGMVRTWRDRPADPATGKPTLNMKAESYKHLAAIMRTAVEAGLIPHTPCTIRGAGKPPKAKEKEPLTRAELLAVIAAASHERWRALLAVMAFCGLRFSEAAQLKVVDVYLDAEKPHLFIRDSKTDSGVRKIYIAPVIVEMLKVHRDTYAGPVWMFPGPVSGRPVSNGSTRKMLLRASTAAGEAGLVRAHLLEPDEVTGRGGHVHPHLLRHSAATLYAAMPGVTAKHVQVFLGHSTPEMAMHYMHVSDESQFELMAGM